MAVFDLKSERWRVFFIRRLHQYNGHRIKRGPNVLCAQLSGVTFHLNINVLLNSNVDQRPFSSLYRSDKRFLYLLKTIPGNGLSRSLKRVINRRSLGYKERPVRVVIWYEPFGRRRKQLSCLLLTPQQPIRRSMERLNPRTLIDLFFIPRSF